MFFIRIKWRKSIFFSSLVIHISLWNRAVPGNQKSVCSVYEHTCVRVCCELWCRMSIRMEIIHITGNTVLWPLSQRYEHQFHGRLWTVTFEWVTSSVVASSLAMSSVITGNFIKNLLKISDVLVFDNNFSFGKRIFFVRLPIYWYNTEEWYGMGEAVNISISWWIFYNCK